MKVRTGRVLTGPAGSAIEVIPAEHDHPDTTATVASWYLTCPRQSPAWVDYMLAIVHLRPIPGQSQEPQITVEGATHEVLIVALDPTTDPTPHAPERWRYLHPLNVVEQIVLPDDQAAAYVAIVAARTVVLGGIWVEPPLSGQVEPWRSALRATAEHLWHDRPRLVYDLTQETTEEGSP